MRNKKKKNINTSYIPYDKCYENESIIQSKKGNYSISYKVFSDEVEELEKDLIIDNLSLLYGQLSNVNIQFTIRNAPIELEQYLKRIKICKKNDETLDEIIEDYNNVLEKNCAIGHNNYKTSVILTISVNADVYEDALFELKEAEEEIKNKLQTIPGIKFEKMNLLERLEFMHNIFHPDITNNMDISQFKRVSTKEMIGVEHFDKRHRNSLKLDNYYLRMFFINNLPTENADSILTDLISVSNNSILSANYQTLDAMLGYEAAKKKIEGNTEIEEIPVRRTIEDRKNKKVLKMEKVIKENEHDNFVRTAISTLKDSVINEENMMQATFVIGLYADSLEELDRDTKLLKLSASKYSCQIKTCDYTQTEALMTVLPLAEVYIDTSRVFNIPTVSRFLPFDVNNSKTEKRTLNGLNSINDNLVMIDQSKNCIGMITGGYKAGKTYSLKRSVVNTLIATEDTVVILSPDILPYEKLIKRMRGKVFKSVKTDLFTKDKDYGLLMELKKARGIFIEAFITSRNEIHTRRLLSEGQKEIYKEIENEAGFINEMQDLECGYRIGWL